MPGEEDGNTSTQHLLQQTHIILANRDQPSAFTSPYYNNNNCHHIMYFQRSLALVYLLTDELLASLYGKSLLLVDSRCV